MSIEKFRYLWYTTLQIEYLILLKIKCKQNFQVKEEIHMEKYVCVVCGWVYDEAVEGVKFEDQPADYVCPLCGVGKDQFEKM